ncbi:MAG: class I adenylate-forming enzyme family protein, partial [Myxococcota bacterium]
MGNDKRSLSSPWRRASGVALDGARLIRASWRSMRRTSPWQHVHPRALGALLRERRNPSVGSLFAFYAANAPHQTALLFGDERYRYRDLDRAARAIATALHEGHGLRSHDTVLLALGNVPEHLVLHGALGMIGATVATVSYRSTAVELRHLLEDSGAKAVFTAPSLGPALEEAMTAAVRARIAERVFVVRGQFTGAIPYASLLRTTPRPIAPPDERQKVVIYTSGTTGKPKGAVRSVEVRGLERAVSSALPAAGFFAHVPLGFGRTHLAVCPLYHSTGLGFTLIALALGSRILLHERFEPERVYRDLARHDVAHTAMVPTMLHRLLEAVDEGTIRAERPARSLEAIFCGGAPLSPSLSQRVLDAFGPCLFNFYGATETALVALAGPDDLRRAPGTIGRPIVGNDVRLLDEEGREVAEGEVGELWVKTGNRIDTYLNNPGAMREASRLGYLSVGDLAR